MVVAMRSPRQLTVHRRAGAGFTLVELLVVMVILMILLGLIFVPMYQAFNATKRVETVTMLQSTMSHAMSQMVNDLEEAMFVYAAPPVTAYATADMPDAVYMPFIDIGKPATEDESVIAFYDSGGGANASRGNADRLAYPTRPSDKVIRYFVAPLPGHPAAPVSYMWGEDPALVPGAVGRQGYLNPFDNPYADNAQVNLSTLYRAEFTIGEVQAAGGFSGPVTLADLQDPYFYTGRLASRSDFNPVRLGRYWKTVSMPLSNPEMMDCALYTYDPSRDDERPMMALPAAGQPGAVPGLNLVPLIVPGETVMAGGDREATGYKTKEQFWANLGTCIIQHLNPAAPGPLPQYSAQDAINNPGGSVGPRMLPAVNPVTGELRYSRRVIEMYVEEPVGNPAVPVALISLQTDNPGGSPVFRHLYRVSYGAMRTLPGPGTFNERDQRFKVVYESEIVRLVNRASGQPVQCQRVETEPMGPFQYRVYYDTGIIQFDKLNFPDPNAFEIWVEYDYRDNFAWLVPDPVTGAVDPRGYVDDMLVISYVSRGEMTATLSVTAYDIASGQAIPMSLSRKVRLRNAVR